MGVTGLIFEMYGYPANVTLQFRSVFKSLTILLLEVTPRIWLESGCSCHDRLPRLGIHALPCVDLQLFKVKSMSCDMNWPMQQWSHCCFNLILQIKFLKNIVFFLYGHQSSNDTWLLRRFNPRYVSISRRGVYVSKEDKYFSYNQVVVWTRQ